MHLVHLAPPAYPSHCMIYTNLISLSCFIPLRTSWSTIPPLMRLLDPPPLWTSWSTIPPLMRLLDPPLSGRAGVQCPPSCPNTKP